MKTVEEIKAENERLANKVLRYGLALSLALEIAEQHGTETDQRTCAFIRTAIGHEKPMRGKRLLHVVGGRDTQ